MLTNFDFLGSRRFWSLIVMAIVNVLGAEGIMSGEIVKAISLILTGFITIRTADKFAESLKPTE